MTEAKELPYLAVGRAEDAVTLASYSSCENQDERRQIEEIFTKLLHAAKKKLRKEERTRLAWNGGSVCCQMDAQGQLLYCVVTSSISYPEPSAYKLISEFSQMVLNSGKDLATMPEGALTEVLAPQMRDLLEAYDSIAHKESALNKAQKAVDVVRSHMRDNCSIQMANLGDAQALESKTGAAVDASARFNAQSAGLHQQMRRRNMRNMMILAVAAVCVLLLFIFIISRGSSKPASDEAQQQTAGPSRNAAADGDSPQSVPEMIVSLL
mmetsp:Transcript_10383/g.23463  ORF Transcript_10383/g.23463 Transcript_10383/m.23463 type:complete len:267 (+) Transcript_10383:142-942(+)